MAQNKGISSGLCLKFKTSFLKRQPFTRAEDVAETVLIGGKSAGCTGVCDLDGCAFVAANNGSTFTGELSDKLVDHDGFFYAAAASSAASSCAMVSGERVVSMLLLVCVVRWPRAMMRAMLAGICTCSMGCPVARWTA